MNNRLSIIVLIISVLSELGLAISNTSVRSPVVSGTVPPSSTSRSLSATPNPMDNSSNLVITGNVTGGKHFRGQVPYGSTTSFRASLGSASLDSFLRYSTPDTLLDSAGFNRYPWDSSGTAYSSPGQYRPFFSPTGTVATTVAGTKRDLTANAGYDWTVRSKTPQEMNKLISNELGLKLPQSGSLDDLWSETTKIERYTQPSVNNTSGNTGRMQNISAGVTDNTRDILRGTNNGVSSGVSGTGSNAGLFPSDVKEIDRLIAGIETRIHDSNLAVAARESSPKSGTATSHNYLKTVESAGQASSYNSEDKFNWYMQAADLYLKQGRYYRAADSFTMASIYKPDMPSGGLAFAGKSRALLAAGEYMTSALFLSRTIEVLPEYARLKIDLVDVFGDQDKLAGRITDVEDRLRISGAGELKFLLSYIYYQHFLNNGIIKDELDRLDAAQRLIDAAYQEMPNSRAVSELRSAVNETINKK